MDMNSLMEVCSQELRTIIHKSFSYWTKNGSKSISSLQVIYIALDENVKCDKIKSIFNHFDISIEDTRKMIESKFPPEKKSLVRTVDFTPEMEDSITESLSTIQKRNGVITPGSVDTTDVFLAMCQNEDNEVGKLFTNIGISAKIIEEYLDSLIDESSDEEDDNSPENDDPLKSLASRLGFGNNITGTGGSKDGIDTLEYPDPSKAKKQDHSPNNNSNNKKKSDKSGKTKTPAVDQFSTNLVELVAEGKISNIIGRDKEIEILMEILCRKNKRNAILLGDPGVGKTAIVEGLAIECYHNRVPLPLKDKRIMALDVNAIVAGTRFRGDFEERMNVIIQELCKSDNTIVFIDEIHTIMGAGNGVGGMDIGNVLKPALARGEIQVIGATTQDEYSKYFSKDGALDRRFQAINIEEPSIEDATEILRGLKNSFEEFHHVKIAETAIESAVRFSKKYIPSRYLPDKSIDLLDIAGAKTKMRTRYVPDEITALKERLEDIIERKDNAARSSNKNLAKTLYDQELSLREVIERKENAYYESLEDDIIEITDQDVAEVISKITDIPTSKVSQDDSERLLRLEDSISTKLVGQTNAISSVCRSIRRSMTDLHDSKKPIGNFLFAGPTGVGKTELARQLALELFGKETNLLKFDIHMSIGA